MKRSREEDVFVTSLVPTHLRNPIGTSSTSLHHTVYPLIDRPWSSWTGFPLAYEQIDNVFFADDGSTGMVDSKIVSLPCISGVADEDEHFLEDCGFIDLIGTSENSSLINLIGDNVTAKIGFYDEKKDMNAPFSHNVTVDTTYKHQSTSSSAITTFTQERGIELSLSLEGLRGITTVLEQSLPVTLFLDPQ